MTETLVAVDCRRLFNDLYGACVLAAANSPEGIRIGECTGGNDNRQQRAGAERLVACREVGRLVTSLSVAESPSPNPGEQGRKGLTLKYIDRGTEENPIVTITSEVVCLDEGGGALMHCGNDGLKGRSGLAAMVGGVPVQEAGPHILEPFLFRVMDVLPSDNNGAGRLAL